MLSTVKRVAIAALVVLGVAGCGGSGPAAAPVTVTKAPTSSGPATFSASGYIDVDPPGYNARKGARCYSDSGYDDVRKGAQVTVSDPQGAVVAVGHLGVGHRSAGGYAAYCRFRFTVDGIPDGLPLYSVEVSHRGALTYDEAQMKHGLAFTLSSS
jgi:hypothetical protein